MAYTVIPPRDFAAAPMTRVEIDNMLLGLVGVASDPVMVTFATALQTHLGNRHVQAKEVAYEMGHPVAGVDLNQYGVVEQPIGM